MTTSPHITNSEWMAYRRRSLTNDQLLRVSEHVHSCESCRRAVVGQAPELPEAAREGRQADAPLHLTYEQLTGYLEAGRPAGVPEWSAVEQHLSFCRTCATELRDLHEFDVRSESAVRVPVPAKAVRPGLFDAIRHFFAFPQTPAFTGAAAAMAMAGIFVLVNGASAVADPASPSTAVGAIASDSYFVRHALSLQNVTGALLAVTGVAALVYRFTAKNK